MSSYSKDIESRINEIRELSKYDESNHLHYSHKIKEKQYRYNELKGIMHQLVYEGDSNYNDEFFEIYKKEISEIVQWVSDNGLEIEVNIEESFGVVEYYPRDKSVGKVELDLKRFTFEESSIDTKAKENTPIIETNAEAIVRTKKIKQLSQTNKQKDLQIDYLRRYKRGDLTDNELQQIVDSNRKINGKINYTKVGEVLGINRNTVKNLIIHRKLTWLINPPSNIHTNLIE